VTAKDQFGNVATGYAGTVTFASSDVAGTINGSSITTFTYTFVSGDAGTHTFLVTLNTVPISPQTTQTITVTDPGPPVLTQTATITVT